jgi:putative ABC transport system ATP-binding protein
MIRGSFLARRGTAGAPGHAGPVAVQYAVLDRAGRVQLPSEMTARLGMRDRARLEEEPDHIRVWPDRPSPPPDGTDLSPAGGEG